MSSSSPIVRLPLPAMTAVIAGLTIVALVLAVKLDWGFARYAFFALPAAVAVYYLNEYRKLPYEPYHFWPHRTPAAPAPTPASTSPSTAAAVEDEPFEDPVEEADRIASDPSAATPTTDVDEIPGGP